VDAVEAAFKNGVLYLSLPRSEADKPKKITVKS
jgi:HSP20 family molecular chaperone IbpA